PTGVRKWPGAAIKPQQYLYFLPLPQGQDLLRPSFTLTTVAHLAVQSPGQTGGGPLRAAPVFKSRRRENVAADMAIMRRGRKLMRMTTSTASGHENEPALAGGSTYVVWRQCRAKR